MFGDVGHGFIMTIFGALLVIFEKRLAKIKTDNEIWNIFFGGRYIILLMGIFSMYTGLIYNDMFSKSFNIFGSSWMNVYDNETLMNHRMLELDPTIAYTGTPYPFGMDPAWQVRIFTYFTNFTHLHYAMVMSLTVGQIEQIFNATVIFQTRTCSITQSSWECNKIINMDISKLALA